MLNIFGFNNFPKNQALGSSLLLAYSWLSMALDLAQMVLDVRKSLKPTQFYMMNIFCFNNFPKKSSPGSVLALGLLLAVYDPGPGPVGPGGPEKTLNQPSFTCLTSFVKTTFPKNQALWASLLSAHSWLSMALDLAQMVLEVRKNPKPTQFYRLNIFGFNNFPKKSSSGVVLALGLLLAVFGPGPGPDGPGCREKLKINPVDHP